MSILNGGNYGNQKGAEKERIPVLPDGWKKQF